MKFIKFIIIALLFLIAISFAMKNSGNVVLTYYFTDQQLEIPLFILLFACVIFGILIGGLEGLYERMRSGNVIRKLKKEITAKDKELTSLRNLPLTESKAITEEVGVPEGTELKEV